MVMPAMVINEMVMMLGIGCVLILGSGSEQRNSRVWVVMGMVAVMMVDIELVM
jgi:hypothetical protein